MSDATRSPNDLPTAQPGDGWRSDAPPRPLDEQPGTLIGPYKLLQVLGEGGFGTVWLAERREPMVQRVALKIIKPGMDSRAVVARFEQERQALAVMDHPNVARVLDGGVTPAGRPYFVMEHVKGEPITTFADRQCLTLKQRLELFLPVCDAIQHAHMKGIIHRDLKPSNILVAHVGDPTRSEAPAHGMVVKVIDFGVAKAISHTLTDKTIFTEQGQIIGTPEYMSPEQAEMGATDIDTRSDVYSLGVVLYELLSGTLPFDAKTLRSGGYNEIQRIIREVDPPRPSTRFSTIDHAAGIAIAKARQAEREKISAELRRELDWIPMKALRKDRTRRYASADALAADVRRYLQGRPLEAAPESKAYLLRKFIRRNQVQVVGAAAVMVALVAGFGTALWQARVAMAQRNEAQAQRTEAEKQRAEAEAQKTDAQHQRQEADKQRAEAETQRAEAQRRQRQSEAVVDFINTDVFANAAPDQMQDAKVRDEIVSKMLEPAVVRVRERFEDQPLVEAAVMHQIARTLDELGRPKDAEPLFRDAADRRRSLLGEDNYDTLESVSGYAMVIQAQGRIDEAEPLLRDVMERRRRTLGDDDNITLTSASNYARLLGALGRYAEAEPILKDVLERRRRTFGNDKRETIEASNNYGYALYNLGRISEAEPLMKEAMEGFRKVVGPDSSVAMQMQSNYATVLWGLGKSAEAEALCKDVTDRYRRVYGPDHPDTLGAVNNYAIVLQALDRNKEAVELLKDLIERRIRVQGADHPETLVAQNNYAKTLFALGRQTEAVATYEEVLKRSRQVHGDDHPDTILALHNYASALQAVGRVAEAEPFTREAVERADRHPSLGPNHPYMAIYANRLAQVLDDLRRPDEAAALRAKYHLPPPPERPKPATAPASQPKT